MHSVSVQTYGEPALHTTEGIVTDTRTQLQWQKCRYGQNLSSSNTCTGTVLQLPFHEALAWCENLTSGNHSDWRLPSIRELTTLALYSEDADINTEFGPEEEGLLGQMWSATPHMTDSAVWVFNLFGPYWQKGGSSQTLIVNVKSLNFA